MMSTVVGAINTVSSTDTRRRYALARSSSSSPASPPSSSSYRSALVPSSRRRYLLSRSAPSSASSTSSRSCSSCSSSSGKRASGSSPWRSAMTRWRYSGGTRIPRVCAPRALTAFPPQLEPRPRPRPRGLPLDRAASIALLLSKISVGSSHQGAGIQSRDNRAFITDD